MANLLIVDSDTYLCEDVSHFFRSIGHTMRQAADLPAALELLGQQQFDVVISDVRVAGGSIQELLGALRAGDRDTALIVDSELDAIQEGVQAVRDGAFSILQKPFSIPELSFQIKRALEAKGRVRQPADLAERYRNVYRPYNFIGESPEIKKVFKIVHRVAGTDSSVLITGETGTGKELVAGAIHYNSKRSDGPFVRVNCAALPEQLLESELFGYEAGAFTGAERRRIGRFEHANGGTIFLDEVAELPHGLQAKLLRALQEREIERVGGSRTIGVDVRLVAATNRDLEAEVRAGRFRDDLYFRLHVVPIQIPPLRERPDDIPLLAEHFLQIYGQKYQKQVYELTPQALAWCRAYPWPGNVRELENVIQRGVLLAQGATLGLEALPQGASTPSNPLAGLLDPSLLTEFGVPLAKKLEAVTETIEAAVIRAALAEAAGKRQEAANLLGISRKSLFNKMLKYGLFE
jgi:DNA-binding NtrC family response regulator